MRTWNPFVSIKIWTNTVQYQHKKLLATHTCTSSKKCYGYVRGVKCFITLILKSLMVFVIWLALIGVIYSWIAPFFVLNHIFSPSNEEASLKTKQPIRFQGLFSNRSNCKKVKDKKYHVANFTTFVFKTLIFRPKKWMNLFSNQLSNTSIKYLNWPNPEFGWFQNGCNKVVIEPHVMQFWFEIILVILNRARITC